MLRYATFAAIIAAFILFVAIPSFGVWSYALAAFSGGLVLVGIRDLTQTKHAVLRNYPVLGHIRYFVEMIRPEIRQYLLESDDDEVPFSREDRAIVYQRAKNVEDKRPFGTKKTCL